MQLSEFDYDLPAKLIAQQPLSQRDASRMMVVDRAGKSWRDSQFTCLPEHLRANDILVLNNTRVFPARLIGKRKSGGAVELLLMRELEPNVWTALARPARRLPIGARVDFGQADLQVEVIDSMADGVRAIRFTSGRPVSEIIDEIGKTPLPPYIKRDRSDLDRDKATYQTVYAKQRGAIAAPTAGLHFTEQMLEKVRARGVSIAEVTLHVGYGTFEPVRVDNVEQHRVAAEWFSISEESAALINQARASGGRIVAVGTTTVRALESAATADDEFKARQGFADLTILPGHKFRAVDAMLTNFHLPRSSLLILVSAFAGREIIISAYEHAVQQRYRFYSYGDCMLIS